MLNGENGGSGENDDNPLECGLPYFQTRHMAVCQTWVSSNHPVDMDDHDLALNPMVTTEDPPFYETHITGYVSKLGTPRIRELMQKNDYHLWSPGY